MNVLFDHQIFTFQNFGGISRYIVELIKNLPGDITPKDSILYSDNIYTKEIGLHPLTFPPRVPGRRTFYNIADTLWSTYKLRENKFDVFHPTYYSPYFLKHLKKPYVITVHDMTHELIFGKEHCKQAIEDKRESITNASKIIAISENTKKDIVNIYGIDESRISVIYHGQNRKQAVAEPIENLPKHYLLYVGGRWTYKNFQNFLEAFALINKEHQEIELICTGNRFTEEENNTITKYGLTNKVRSIFVTDGQLTTLYQNALCFVYPSLYEGFGIPILEAFSAKCPIALSNTSCFPEIAKDGGAYFDPTDYSSMASSILRVIEDTTFRENLIQRGSNILSDFTWEKTAQQTATVYKSLM